MWHLITTTLEMGALYTLVVIAAWLTSTLLNYDDLSLEASFGLGGALQARLLLWGLSPLYTPFCIFFAGIISGLMTGILHTVLGLNNVLTGIIMVTAFFSINMFVGTINLSILQYGSLFNALPTIPYMGTKAVILVAIALSFIIFICWLLSTQIGFLMRATGSNPLLVTSLGKSPRRYFMLSLILAHAIVALAGALFVQYTGYFSLWSSTGILVAALTGLVIARSLSSRFGIELLLGACIYQTIIATSLSLHIAPEWSRFVTASLLVLLMASQRKTKYALHT